MSGITPTVWHVAPAGAPPRRAAIDWRRIDMSVLMERRRQAIACRGQGPRLAGFVGHGDGLV